MNVQLFNYHKAGAQVCTRPPSFNPVTSQAEASVTTPVKSFATLGMQVAAWQLILKVGSALCVAGALLIIVQRLVHLRSPLVPTVRILRNQSAASAINCLCLCCLAGLFLAFNKIHLDLFFLV